mgnify:CR=1 FL=1
MNKVLAISFIFTVALASGKVLAAGETTSYPASNVAAVTAATASSKLWVDKNGDGIIQRDEAVPGSQIEKRFATRDANKDGQLTQDEYFAPK